MVRDEEVYGRFIMYPRHFKDGILGDEFISLRPCDKGGISGFILSRLKIGESLNAHKKELEKQTKQSITSMGLATAKAIRECSLGDIIVVDVIITESKFPYHAEIHMRMKDGQLIVKNLSSAEFMYVHDALTQTLLRNRTAI